MKRCLAFLLAALMLLGIPAAAADTDQYLRSSGAWTVKEYVDDFDDPTGNFYLISTLEGNYSNAAVNKGKLTVLIYYADSAFSIRLLENGQYRPTYTSNTEIVLKYKVDDVIQSYTLAALSAPYGDIIVSDYSQNVTEYDETAEYMTATQGLQALLALKNSRPVEKSAYAQMLKFITAGQDVRCVLLIGSDKYSFTVKSKGFADAAFGGVYDAARGLVKDGSYEEAIALFETIRDYKDSTSQITACETAIKDEAYEAATALQAAGHYTEAIAAYKALNGHRDSAEKIAACETAIKDEAYEAAVALQAAGQYTEAIAAYKALNGYRDSAAQITACDTAIKDEAYEAAAAMQAAGQYTEAIAAYKALNGHRDSAAQITACQTAIKDGAYEAAAAMQAAGQYTEAIAAYKALNGYRDSAEQIAACETAISDEENAAAYDAAAALMKSGKYAEAYAAYIQLKGYKDVDTLLATDENLKAAAAAAAAAAAREARELAFRTVGAYVTFGSYEQDNNSSNGQEAIEWLVLEVQGNKALLISRYGLDAQPYNKEWTSVTWETSTLRSWLNGTFLNAAFTAEEQGAILTTSVDNSASQCYRGWSTKGGNNTQDKIFLLSYAEANKYLKVTYSDRSNTTSRVSPTAYAKAQGAWTSDSKKTAEGVASGWWWLRSPGNVQDHAARVYYDGSLFDRSVSNSSGCVRPAFWINLDSGIF